MTLSGWARLWIVATALPVAACGDVKADDALSEALDAKERVQALQSDLHQALSRIETLERKVESLEGVSILDPDKSPPEVVLPDFVFDTPPPTEAAPRH